MFERQDSAPGATHSAAAQNRGRRRPPAKGRIRILIVDDHTVVRHGLRQVLEREPDMEIIGEAGTGLDAVLMAEGERPDVVLLDAKLGDAEGASRVIANVRTGNGKAVSPGAAVLFQRDLAIGRYSGAGLTNKAIAARVHHRPHTIKDRLEKIAAGFGVRSRTEIVAEAIR